MKKVLSIVVICCIVVASVCVLAACDNLNSDGKIKIVTTIFSEYDWTLNVLGEHAENAKVTNLLNSGVDMHSYQPSVADVANIATCDLFIYVGGESDDWVEAALRQATNKDMLVIKLLDVVADSALDEEHKDGMQGDEEDEGAADEHVWLSLKRAKVVVNAIADALAQLDAANADDYAQNAASYCDQIDKLDGQYQQAVATAAHKTLVVADRFPFLYLFKDYGLDYFAAFSGCSAETEASVETIAFLVQKVDELQSNVLIKTETGNEKIAQTIISELGNKNIKILTLNSLQSTSAQDRAKGTSYLSIMQSNLQVLSEAIG